MCESLHHVVLGAPECLLLLVLCGVRLRRKQTAVSKPSSYSSSERLRRCSAATRVPGLSRLSPVAADLMQGFLACFSPSSAERSNSLKKLGGTVTQKQNRFRKQSVHPFVKSLTG